jgi:hypothetical protein
MDLKGKKRDLSTEQMLLSIRFFTDPMYIFPLITDRHSWTSTSGIRNHSPVPRIIPVPDRVP